MDGMLRFASSARTAARSGWLVGEERSALYPAALIAAITVNRLWLASSCPVSAGKAAALTANIRGTVSTRRYKWMHLAIYQFTIREITLADARPYLLACY